MVMVLNKPELVLSRLYMYYQERAKEGTVSEDSGAQMRDICKVAVMGVCEENFFPYVIGDFANAPTMDAVANAATHKCTSYHSVRTLAEIKEAIGLHGQPVLMGMEVFASFESEAVAKTGKMPMPKAGEQNLGGHAVLIVGYDDTKQCLIVRNSWGEAWGDKGYFYMPYAYVQAGLAFDFWVLS
jgi:C1A family cysteine protease